MLAPKRVLERVSRAEPATWLVVASLAALGFAYASLVAVGSNYGFEKSVEYWLFRPTDNAPVAIVVLSAWLLYRRWYRLQSLPPSSASPLWVGACVLAAIAVHGWAIYTRADDLKVLSLALGTSGMVLAWRNAAGLRAVCLPILFLLFAIPIPAPLLLAVVFKLQLWTAQLAGLLLFLLGSPALVSGDQILRATQTFQVVEGCSGIRSIETLTMLTLLLVDLFGRRGWHVAILLVMAPPIAFLLNGFRVLTMILNPHSEIIAIHNLQGIAILIVGLLLVYGLDVLIERMAGDRLPEPWRAPAESSRRPFSPRVAFGSLAVFAVATMASSFATPVWQEVETAPRELHDLVGAQLDAWPSEAVDRDYIFQGSTRYREILHRRYALDSGPVTVFIATADLGQRGGSLFSPLTSQPGSGWLQREAGRVEVEGVERPVDAYVFEKGSKRVLVHHWFVGARGLAVETWRSLSAIDRSSARRTDIPYVVRLEAPILGHGDEDRAAAADQLEFVNRQLRPVYDALASVGSAGPRAR